MEKKEEKSSFMRLRKAEVGQMFFSMTTNRKCSHKVKRLRVTSSCSVVSVCPTLWDPMDCSSPSSSVHGILQAGILEWEAISFSSGSSWPRGWTWVSCIAGNFFSIWATRDESKCIYQLMYYWRFRFVFILLPFYIMLLRNLKVFYM